MSEPIPQPLRGEQEGRAAAAAARVAPGGVVRSRGKRDPRRTFERILSAAMVEFCRHGLNGARVDRIVAAARINPRMLYHYFGSKAGLYVAVLDRAYGELRTRERALQLQDLSPLEGMRRLMDFTFDHFGSHPDLIQLINSENLLHARYLKRSKQAALTSPLVAAIRDLLRRGERDGTFRRGVDPVQLYVSITALSYFHVSNRFTLSTIFEADLANRRWIGERRVHAREVLLSYLQRQSAAAGPSAPGNGAEPGEEAREHVPARGVADRGKAQRGGKRVRRAGRERVGKGVQRGQPKSRGGIGEK
jgi:AcrR family transcriptional regulator